MVARAPNMLAGIRYGRRAVHALQPHLRCHPPRMYLLQPAHHQRMELELSHLQSHSPCDMAMEQMASTEHVQACEYIYILCPLACGIHGGNAHRGRPFPHRAVSADANLHDPLPLQGISAQTNKVHF